MKLYLVALLALAGCGEVSQSKQGSAVNRGDEPGYKELARRRWPRAGQRATRLPGTSRCANAGSCRMNT